MCLLLACLELKRASCDGEGHKKGILRVDKGILGAREGISRQSRHTVLSGFRSRSQIKGSFDPHIHTVWIYCEAFLDYWLKEETLEIVKGFFCFHFSQLLLHTFGIKICTFPILLHDPMSSSS